MYKTLLILGLIGFAWAVSNIQLDALVDDDCQFSLKTSSNDTCSLWNNEKECLKHNNCVWNHSCYGGNFCYSKK